MRPSMIRRTPLQRCAFPLFEAGRAGSLCSNHARQCMFMPAMFQEPGARYSTQGANAGPWGFVCSQPLFYYGKDPVRWGWAASQTDSHVERARKRPSVPKPIGQTGWMVARLLSGETVWNPSWVPGTGVACANRCPFIGIEIDPSYFDIACRRIEEAYRQPRLFDEPPPKPVQVGLFDGGPA